LSSMKSTRTESSSSPIAMSSEIGSFTFSVMSCTLFSVILR
jgi:hypothetical protein